MPDRPRHEQPTVEDLALDPGELLDVCLKRLAAGWDDLPMHASPGRTIAALCRRLLAAETKLAKRDQNEADLRRQYDEAFRAYRVAAEETRRLTAQACRMRQVLLRVFHETRLLLKNEPANDDAANLLLDVVEALGMTTAQLAEELDA